MLELIARVKIKFVNKLGLLNFMRNTFSNRGLLKQPIIQTSLGSVLEGFVKLKVKRSFGDIAQFLLGQWLSDIHYFCA